MLQILCKVSAGRLSKLSITSELDLITHHWWKHKLYTQRTQQRHCGCVGKAMGLINDSALQEQAVLKKSHLFKQLCCSWFSHVK